MGVPINQAVFNAFFRGYLNTAHLLSYLATTLKPNFEPRWHSILCVQERWKLQWHTWLGRFWRIHLCWVTCRQLPQVERSNNSPATMGVNQESWSILMEDNGRLMAFYVRWMAFRGIYNQPSSKWYNHDWRSSTSSKNQASIQSSNGSGPRILLYGQYGLVVFSHSTRRCSPPRWCSLNMYLGFSDNIERAKIRCFMITFLFKKVFFGGYGSIHTHPNMTLLVIYPIVPVDEKNDGGNPVLNHPIKVNNYNGWLDAM